MLNGNFKHQISAMVIPECLIPRGSPNNVITLIRRWSIRRLKCS